MPPIGRSTRDWCTRSAEPARRPWRPIRDRSSRTVSLAVRTVATAASATSRTPPRKNRSQASHSLRRGSSRNCLYVNGWLPTRTGRAHIGGFGKAIALGLGLRHDWGSQYKAKQFQAEIKWLGIRSTSAYVGEPECNGVAERFIRTLKEECIHLHDFDNLEEARAVIGAFIERYNNGWLLQRHGYLTPARAREKLSRRAA